MKKSNLATLLAAGALTAGGFTGCKPAENNAHEGHVHTEGLNLGSMAQDPRAMVFDRLDEEGKRFTSLKEKDKIYIAAFVFTECTTVCPLTIPNAARLQEALSAVKPDLADKVEIILFTVDPVKDRPATLKKTFTSYAGREPNAPLNAEGEKITVPLHLLTLNEADAAEEKKAIMQQAMPGMEMQRPAYINDAIKLGTMKKEDRYSHPADFFLIDGDTGKRLVNTNELRLNTWPSTKSSSIAPVVEAVKQAVQAKMQARGAAR